MSKINDHLDTLLKIKELLPDTDASDKNTSSDYKTLNLKTTIEELRGVYEWVCTSYREVKSKLLTFLAGGLAVLTFLYSRQSGVFIPGEVYGKIFYFAGLGLMLLGFGLIFTALRPVHWEFPTEHKDLEKMNFSSELEYLEYVKNRYLYCYNIDIKVYEQKHWLLNASFYLLLFGATILIVINIFGGKQ